MIKQKRFKNKIKASILSIFACSSMFASSTNIEIQNIGLMEGSLKYENTLFNKKVTITPGCKSVGDLFQEIERNSGYKILNNTNIETQKTICGAYKYELLGDILNNIIIDMNVVYHEVGDQRVVLEYATEHSIKLPMNWDIQGTESILKSKFPNIKTYYFGQTIRMVGNSQEMIEAKNVLDSISEWAQRKIPISININKLNLKEVSDNEEVIAKIDKGMFDKTHKFNASHGLIFPIENIGSIVFDFQKNSVVLNGNKYIPFQDLKDYAFMKEGTQISFNVPFGFFIE